MFRNRIRKTEIHPTPTTPNTYCTYFPTFRIFLVFAAYLWRIQLSYSVSGRYLEHLKQRNLLLITADKWSRFMAKVRVKDFLYQGVRARQTMCGVCGSAVQQCRRRQSMWMLMGTSYIHDGADVFTIGILLKRRTHANQWKNNMLWFL